MSGSSKIVMGCDAREDDDCNDDDAGLADDGTLDPAVAQLLLGVHGT
jgi:hypothetical protein